MRKEAIEFEGMGRKGVRYTTQKTVMEILLRPEVQSASIMKVWGVKPGKFEEGTKKDVLLMIEQFKQDFPSIVCILDQVHRTKEATDMYEAGLRWGSWSVRNFETVYTSGHRLEHHLGALTAHGSICMAWYAPDAHKRLGKAIPVEKII